MLDLEIIHSTNAEKSLDDVLIYLYKEYYEKKKRGFTAEEAKAAIEKIAGHKLDDLFDKYVNGTETIDYNKYLGYVGLKINDINLKEKKPSLGVRTTGTNKLEISSVTRNTTAYKGGLSANDEIIAINGNRVNSKTLNQIIELYEVGSEIEVTIARDNILMNLKMELLADPSVDYRMSLADNVTSDHRRALEKWLVKK
jgi:predicted metalloprotease with PDZ domain